jgi:diamine N-acetyltransferase
LSSALTHPRPSGIPSLSQNLGEGGDGGGRGLGDHRLTNMTERILMHLRGEKVIIRPMVREDVEKMRAWRPFTDSLDSLWNEPQRSSDNDIWFKAQTGDPSRRWYAVEDFSGRLLGRLSLRQIVGRESARLGITLAADYVGQGYGTDAIRTFLAYYFGELGFETLYLDVAAPNQRAIHCYEKCGFKYIGSHYREVGSDERLAFLKDERYCDLRRFFKRENGRNSRPVLRHEDREEGLKSQYTATGQQSGLPRPRFGGMGATSARDLRSTESVNDDRTTRCC